MACLNGEKGVELQLKAERKTHTVAKPYPSFIPTIVYDEVNRIIDFIFSSLRQIDSSAKNQLKRYI